MSTVGDENAGPALALKGTGSQEGTPSSALKQSNKANIMSPPPSSKKQLDRGDGPAPADATLMKENLDQTVGSADPSATDDDIISFKPPVAETDSESDPFQPRTQLANSPVLNKDAALSACSTLESVENPNEQEVCSEDRDVHACPSVSEDSLKNEETPAITALDPLEASDPFKPRSQLGNSPVKLSECENCVDFSENAQNSGKSSEKMESANVTNKEQRESVPSNTSDKLCSKLEESKVSDEVQAAVDPFKPSSQLVNSPTNLDVDLDPFKPKKQIANSPVTAANSSDSFKPSGQLANSPEKTGAVFDPLKPKNQLDISPEKPVNEAKEEGALQKPAEAVMQSSASPPDQISAESQQSSSAITSAQASNPLEPNSQVTQLSTMPENVGQDDLEPFKPSKQLVNSPDKLSAECSAVLDPKEQLVKSPSKVGCVEDMDPFKPKTQGPSSPVRALCSDQMKSPTLEETNTATVSLQREEEASSEVDPFKPKAPLMNSPLKTGVGSDESVDPFKPKSQSKLIAEDLDFDPFKPESKQKNSPAKNGTTEVETNPFKPRAQLTNSPDAFKPIPPPATSSNIEDVDAKMPLPNSPTKAEDIGSEVDPFKPKAQVTNSPTKAGDILAEVNPFEPEAQLANSPPKTSALEIDPFKPKAQLVNSPTKTDDICSEVKVVFYTQRSKKSAMFHYEL
ncbi:hypothetical protein ACOMHN_025409 [Nucella lapillus]